MSRFNKKEKQPKLMNDWRLTGHNQSWKGLQTISFKNLQTFWVNCLFLCVHVMWLFIWAPFSCCLFGVGFQSFIYDEIVCIYAGWLPFCGCLLCFTSGFVSTTQTMTYFLGYRSCVGIKLEFYQIKFPFWQFCIYTMDFKNIYLCACVFVYFYRSCQDP